MKTKLIPEEFVFTCNGPKLAIKWLDKKTVTVITTIHEATEVVTKKKYTGENAVKPEAIFYTLIL